VPGQIGLLVMTDEEGGGVQRMANLVGWLPWPAWMGSNWSAAQIQAAVTQVGSKMYADEVNMDLAPVIDVDGTNAAPSGTNPDGWRSFSGNTAVVSKDGIAFMNGLRSAGVIPVLKHFPGLGGSTGNTDNGSAQTLPWTTLQQVAIPPFAAAIAAGAPAVMVSNATVPGLTTLPASLSPDAMAELTITLQFHGLVITDSLSAGAIAAAGFTVPAAAVQALKAGADMVMFGLPSSSSATVSQTFAIRSAIVAAVANGTLARSRLIDATAAVLAVRHVDLRAERPGQAGGHERDERAAAGKRLQNGSRPGEMVVGLPHATVVVVRRGHEVPLDRRIELNVAGAQPVHADHVGEILDRRG